MNCVNNELFETARANKDNQRMIRNVCNMFRSYLDEYSLIACGDMALWRCLKSHKDIYKQRFTSSLYKFIIWECLRAIEENRRYSSLYYVDDTHLSASDDHGYNLLIIDECMSILSDLEKRVIKARFFEECTMHEIGQREGYTRQGIQVIIKRSIDKMAKFGV